MTVGSPLARRILREHRRVVVPLAVALLVNVAAYAFIVYPLSQRVANIEQRDEAAARELAAAQQEHRQAAGTLTGKDRAALELDRFYNEVLPKDLQAARRLWQTRLPQLATQFDVMMDRRSTDLPDEKRDSELIQLRSHVELAGRYSDLRSFIHQLESSPEFVVLDNIRLSEEDEETGLLQLQVDLSTYYRAPAP
jgi:Tfp pilus assembly protein PilO